ncbi:MAG: hypothetical protein KBS95_03435 [Alistipes sp.]|nr:hypothetical protein [Candidatus Alistipes equi]
MKTINITLFAALMLFAAVSCGKDETLSTSNTQVELTGKLEPTVVCDQTRTVLGQGNTVLWEVGDKLSVISSKGNNEFTVSKVGTPATTATFQGSLSEAEQYYALYPYGSTARLQDGKIIFPVAQEQEYVASSFAKNALACVAPFSKPGDFLNFKNIFGLFKLSLTGSKTISKIVLLDNYGTMLWGNAVLAANSSIGTQAQGLSMQDGNNMVILKNINETLSSTPKDFYFAVPAGAFEYGFTAYVYSDDTIIDILQSVNDNTVVRSTILKMPQKEVTLIKDFDLSLAGTANCYIAPAKGEYFFHATRGENGVTLEPATVEVLWETINTTTPPEKGSIVSSVSVSNDVISLSTTGKRGNALIAGKDASGNIIWSWHIWCSGEPIAVKNYTSVPGSYFFDRSIGALSKTPGTVESGGLIYQFGRKDPFIGAGTIGTSKGVKTPIAVANPAIVLVDKSNENGNFEYTNAHPNHLIVTSGDWLTTSDSNAWGNAGAKTENDPCPYGYKVSSTTHFTNVSFSYDSAHLGAYLDQTEWYQYVAGISGATGSGHNIGKNCYIIVSDTPNDSYVYYVSMSSSKINTMASTVNRASSDPVRCVRE